MKKMKDACNFLLMHSQTMQIYVSVLSSAAAAGMRRRSSPSRSY
jgi:hypothetical protein